MEEEGGKRNKQEKSLDKEVQRTTWHAAAGGEGGGLVRSRKVTFNKENRKLDISCRVYLEVNAAN